MNRIDVGEIEWLLLQHLSVEKCAVIVRETTATTPRIVAYVVGQDLAAASLRAYLRAALPEQMIPNVFVELSELPLTPAGRVDRRALPLPPEHDDTDLWLDDR